MQRHTLLYYARGTSLGARLIRAAVGTAGLRAVSMGLSFAIGVLLARLLGADGYGLYAVVMAIVALLTYRPSSAFLLSCSAR